MIIKELFISKFYSDIERDGMSKFILDKTTTDISKGLVSTTDLERLCRLAENEGVSPHYQYNGQHIIMFIV